MNPGFLRHERIASPGTTRTSVTIIPIVGAILLSVGAVDVSGRPELTPIDVADSPAAIGSLGEHGFCSTSLSVTDRGYFTTGIADGTAGRSWLAAEASAPSPASSRASRSCTPIRRI